jgi:CDP-diacylglycerol--glycerol-3-phosphate 3-phosphatidyltransferase
MDSIASWANAITVGRLVFSPIMFLAIPDHPAGSWTAFLLWSVLCASDGVDGWIARRRGPTAAGAFLDPLADKVLILGAMFTLVANEIFPLLPVLIIAGREIVISVYRVILSGRGISVPASKLAKYKTVFQQLAVAFVLLPWTALDATWLWNGLLWTAVVLALVSGTQYLRNAHQEVTEGSPEPAVS